MHEVEFSSARIHSANAVLLDGLSENAAGLPDHAERPALKCVTQFHGEIRIFDPGPSHTAATDRPSTSTTQRRTIMNEKHRLIIGLLKLWDLALAGVAFALTTVYTVNAEHQVSLARFLAMRIRISNFFIVAFALVVCHVVFRMCGLYRSRRLSRRRAEAFDVLKATTLCTVFLAALSHFFSIRMITVLFLGVFWVLSTAVLVAGRLLLRLLAARIRKRGRDLRFMLILGSNPRAIEFARRIASNLSHGYRLLGFVDDEWPGIGGVSQAGFQVVSDFAGLAEYLRRKVVDEVAIFLPFGSFYKHSSAVADLCQQHGITMRFRTDIFGLKTARWRAEEFEGEHYVATYTGSSELWPRTLKRIMDIAISATALLILAPVLLATAIAIKIFSPGPVFFLQERIGLNKRRFKILKFRTMVRDAEQLQPLLEKHNEASGPVFKIRNDPRITPIGRLLRRSSIDEAPQLLNVLLGDMSLVGPRPLPVRDYEGFSKDWQRRRFSVKPGVTCLWQVNGRSGVPFDQWMRLDLQYMDEWSLWLDLKILARTVPAVLRGAGAA
jgi:exopolysaccharide biosynthesis polyprenyl glycosylphosphotransferase